MKRLLLFFCLVLITTTASAQIWIDADRLSYADVRNNVTADDGKIIPAHEETEQVLGSSTFETYGSVSLTIPAGSYLSRLSVEQECGGTGDGCYIHLDVGSTRILDTTIPKGSYKTYIFPLNYYAGSSTSVTYYSWCFPDGTCSGSQVNFKGIYIYGYPAKPNSYIEVYVDRDELLTANKLYYSGSGVTVNIYDADGNALASNVASGSEISGYYYADVAFPLRIRVSLSSTGYLNYVGVVPDGLVVLADEKGLAVRAEEYVSYSAPAVNTSDVVSGYGNVTVYVYKNGQPVSNAKIRVTNPLGYSYVPSAVTDSNGRIDITGLNSQANWDENIAYTFEVLDLSLDPITDDFGKPLNATVEFLSGIAQTNPVLIFTDAGIGGEYLAYTDDSGRAILSTGADKLLHVTITRDGEVIFEDTVVTPYVIDIRSGGSGGGGGGNETYGNPNSKYVTITDKSRAKAYEPITVKVKNTKKAWWNPFDAEWVEGAEIYVDGVPTGKKTADPSDWGIFDWFEDVLNPTEPYAVIQIGEPGEHYVYAKVGNEYSQATKVTITGEEYDFDGGADSGTYPRTEPSEDNCHYVLLYYPQAIKVGGEVTFKTVKVCNRVQQGTVESTVFLNGVAIGKTEPVLTYPIYDAGLHEVYAEITTSYGVVRTGTGTIYVYSDVNEFDKDGGNLTVTVKALDEFTDEPIPGLVVSLIKDGSIVERKITKQDGSATLTCDAGVNYTIHISDPSGAYQNRLIERQFSSNEVIMIYLRPAGDINGDGGVDEKVEKIELRVDGSDASGQKIWVGTHRISVVDQNGRELADAEIYLNDEYIGKTSGGIFFGAGLDYYFSDPGNFTLRAEYGELVDIAYIQVVDPNSYLLGWKLIKVPEQNTENAMGSAGLGAGIGAIIGALLGGGIGAIPGAAIGAGMGYGVLWAWDQIDEWFKSWQFGDAALPVGAEVEFAILQNGKLVSGGELYINGQKVATFVKEPARYTFDQAGVYNVTAVTSSGEGVENEITIKVGSVGGFSGFLGQLASAYPILGNQAVDSILWAFILLIGGLIVVSLILTLIRAIL